MDLYNGFFLSEYVHRHANRHDRDAARRVGPGVGGSKFVADAEVKRAGNDGDTFHHRVSMGTDFSLGGKLEPKRKQLLGFQVAFDDEDLGARRDRWPISMYQSHHRPINKVAYQQTPVSCSYDYRAL
jgi:hypothetical protein